MSPASVKRRSFPIVNEGAKKKATRSQLSRCATIEDQYSSNRFHDSEWRAPLAWTKPRESKPPIHLREGGCCYMHVNLHRKLEK